MSVSPSTRPSICPSVHLPAVHLSVSPPHRPSTCPLVHRFARPPVRRSICPPVHQSIGSHTRPFTCPRPYKQQANQANVESSPKHSPRSQQPFTSLAHNLHKASFSSKVNRRRKTNSREWKRRSAVFFLLSTIITPRPSSRTALTAPTGGIDFLRKRTINTHHNIITSNRLLGPVTLNNKVVNLRQVQVL